MIIGKLHNIMPTGWDGMEQPAYKEVILDVLKAHNFPILAEVDFGHESINIPMPIGTKALINTTSLEFEQLEGAVI